MSSPVGTKKLLPFVILLLFAAVSKAQSITRAHFVLNRHADGFRIIELELDGRYVVGVSGDGVIQYGEEYVPITYYDKFDIHDIEGRVKSIGDVHIAYNNTFDIHVVKGTIKSIGEVAVKYYDVFDVNEPKGKVKSVGDISIAYRGKTISISERTSKLEVSCNTPNCRYPRKNP